MPGNQLENKEKDKKEKAKKVKTRKMIARITAALFPIMMILLIGIIITTIIVAMISGFLKIINEQVFSIGAESTAKLADQDIVVIDTDEKCLNLSNKVIDQLITNLREENLNVARLKMLGDVSEADMEEMSDKKIAEAMRKYIREYYAAELITQYPDMSATPLERKGFLGLIDKGVDGVNEIFGRYQGCIALVKPDKNGKVYYTEDGKIDASKTSALTYVREEDWDPSMENNFTISGNTIKISAYTEVDGQRTYKEQTVNYQDIAAAYTMPMEFLLMMNLYSQNPEFTYALAKMVENSQIILEVCMNKTVTTEETVTKVRELEPVYENKPVYENGLLKVDILGNPVTEQVQIGMQWGEERTETQTVVTTSYTPSVQLALADTWIVRKQVDYIKEEQTTSNTEEVEIDESERKGTSTTTTTVKSEIFKEDVGSTKEEEKTYKVLGLLRNEKGTYDEENLLEFDPKNRPNMKYVKYHIPNTNAQRTPSANIVTAAKMMIDGLEKQESTQNQAEIMKYLMYIYTGNNVYGGATSFDQLKDLFVTSTFVENSFNSVTALTENFIRNFEGSGPSTDTEYIVYQNAGDYPTVGYGVRVDLYRDKLIAAGANPKDLVVGGKIPKEVVDTVERQLREEKSTRLKAILSSNGIEVTSYQFSALLSRMYNCGEKGITSSYGQESFVAAYKKYWKESDNEYGVTANESMYQHKLYTNSMNKPVKDSSGTTLQGLVKRRKIEWILFKTGIYMDPSFNVIGKAPENANAEKLLAKAYEIMNYMKTNGYTYSLNNLNNTFQASITGNHAACCATYVSWVLQEIGIREECDHSAPKLHTNLLNMKGAVKITNYDDLQAGDIVFLNVNGNPYSHAQIYAGSNTWFSAGTAEAILTKSQPYNQGSWARTHFTEAVRLQLE